MAAALFSRSSAIGSQKRARSTAGQGFYLDSPPTIPSSTAIGISDADICFTSSNSSDIATTYLCGSLEESEMPLLSRSQKDNTVLRRKRTTMKMKPEF